MNSQILLYVLSSDNKGRLAPLVPLEALFSFDICLVRYEGVGVVPVSAVELLELLLE